MVVLSLFDGISCGQIALNKLGIKYDQYFASEIDKDAIEVTQKNFPQTIQLGDVSKISCNDLPQVDLLIGGSPCQGFSLAGKQLNFNDPRSKLFFEFVRLLKECKPKYWLLENVVMKKEYEEIINEYLGVKPILINSALVSAQNRERLYWANFELSKPIDKNIKLNDVLDDKEMNRPAAIRGRRFDVNGRTKDSDKSLPIIQCLEVKSSNIEKSNCLTTLEKSSVLTNLPIGRHLDAYKKKLPFRYFSIKEYCKLQTIPTNYFDGIKSQSKIKKMVGNSWTIDVITHIFECMMVHHS
jgi:DNA (cytosine-5)-methyltransferase 3A